MRGTWIGLAMLASLGTIGCYSTPVKRVKRPELVQEYRLPPDDPRFSQPAAYPTKVLLGDDALARRRELDSQEMKGQMNMSGRPGGMSGGMPGPTP